MSPLSRRGFFGAVSGGVAAYWGSAAAAWPSSAGQVAPAAASAKPEFALIHATDLFRPHADPDDHFDLATAFALAGQGRFELLAVMIDHPPANLKADPDVLAVAQLSRITGLAVPVLTGSARRLDPAEAPRPENRAEIAGATALLRLMRASRLPVVMTIVGSARDVALASRLEPKLFADKCAGVYLNSGSGTPDRAKAVRLEYNVSLDPVSYAALFDLPCPLYWMPCFEVAPGGGVPFAAGEFGTYFRFLQKDFLPQLSPRLQNYFAFMFKQGDSDKAAQAESEALRPNWLQYLEGPRDEALLERQGRNYRNVWSTAGFFHAAGYFISVDGQIRERKDAAAPVYSFDPVRVRCGTDGITEWSPDAGAKNRFLFHVRDSARYPAAMTAALLTQLRSLS